ncbi:MAG: helix-turn-helix transcriptional regulator [Chitinophagaceae bacterium]|nr:helix-turn-helix transcriptional regulator [Chitinophagaceae bacterium]
MKVERFLPSAVLLPFVREFLIIESDLDISSKTIPDTSMTMAFRYMGKIMRMDGDETLSLPGIAIAGLRKSVRQFIYTKHTANLLVIFAPGGINAFSRLPAHELFERHIAAENLFPATELNEIMERLAEAANNKRRVDVIQYFLLKYLKNNEPDALINEALHLIRQHGGIIKIRDLVSSLYISQDAFEKRFRATVGSTPKQYASIVRLRRLIAAYPSFTSLTDASYEAGYFDQSHFIKDFRLFTGQTPKDFFRSPEYW